VLRRATPFPLDLMEGRAFMSLVFFTMRRMRPRRGGRVAEWLLRPMASHEFLNARTYVQCEGEPGIYFLAEWLPNALSVWLGPPLFGLPYRLGKMTYRHSPCGCDFDGRILDPQTGAELSYQGRRCGSTKLAHCAAGSLDEWLMERYTAYTHCRGASRFFHVWHPPWAQATAEVELLDDSLLKACWPWFRDARFIGANYSPGFRDVWMGCPRRRLGRSPCTDGRPGSRAEESR
jgi:uncharacterized protein